ncbi:MAG: arginine deiminase family protein [Candidatus Sericytochromatia bacterium]
MKLRLNSEYGTLQAVLMHRPDREIERLTPYNAKEFLFEDVPYLEDMQKEHDEFTNIIKQASGAKVYRLHELLMQVLTDKKLQHEVFRQILEPLKLAHLTEDIIERFSTVETASALIAGIKFKELKKKFYHKDIDTYDDKEYIISPSPNLYFMRDPAAVVHSGVISSQMKFKARQKESMISRIIFENHPEFKHVYNMAYPYQHAGHYLESNIPCIEGGDVIVLSKKALAIGQSERTDSLAIMNVAKQALKNDDIERVYEVVLPKKRNFMHLDTVFTIIDENMIVTYPDALSAVLETKVHRKKALNENGDVILETEVLNESILDVLKREIKYLEIIETGNGNPEFAEKEQWFDGANVFAIGPRRVISYNRNKYTNRALKEAGVEVIKIRGSELVRGLGGPRCMTMPLQRADL